VEIMEEVKDMVYENYLLLRCKVDGNEILIGGYMAPT
jgi:hypothetical protein